MAARKPKREFHFMRPASEQFPFAVIASIVVVSLLCLWGSFESFDLESNDRQHPGDPFMVTRFMRFEPILSAVPEHAALGYVTDVQSRNLGPAMILSAQFVLAPRLLEKGTAHEWVLGDFTRPADFAAVGQRHGLRLQQDFGNGVVLFRKER